MEASTKATLAKNEVLDDKYTVLLFIKQGATAETYRVKGKDGSLYLLKLLNVSKLHHTAFGESGHILEIDILKQLNHPNLATFRDSGELIRNQKRYVYLVLQWIYGETLAEYAARTRISTAYDVKAFARDILDGLRYLHQLPEPIVHNEITPQNIMIDQAEEIPRARIIDLGYARYFNRGTSGYFRDGLNLHYVASECFNGYFAPQSDLYSVGAVMYYLLFGMPPWNKDLTDYEAGRERLEDILLAERRRPLIMPNVEHPVVGLDNTFFGMIQRALQHDNDKRYASASAFMQALDDLDKQPPVVIISDPKAPAPDRPAPAKGPGLTAVGGMVTLKETLRVEVIDALSDPESYRKWGVTIPNGMLLWGPPGCGKTFIAKRLAEEIGRTYMEIKPSDVGSIYVHGGQEKIARLFDTARRYAPTVLLLDEIDAMIPKRDSDLHHSYAEAVNEWLAQMTDCSDHGLFVIGTTNNPQKIDKAMLRSGRLDRTVYVPPPDDEARKAIFKLYLADRPLEFGIDYDRLAELSKNLVSSDIKMLLNDASRIALLDRTRISMFLLETVLRQFQPTVSAADIDRYEAIKGTMSGVTIKVPVFEHLTYGLPKGWIKASSYLKK